MFDRSDLKMYSYLPMVFLSVRVEWIDQKYKKS